MTHPALSPIIAYSIDPSNPPCIAFPFPAVPHHGGQIVDGQIVDTLKNVLRQCPELSPKHRLKFAVDVADGLSHLHGLDIAHGALFSATISVRCVPDRPQDLASIFSSRANRAVLGFETLFLISNRPPPSKLIDICAYQLLVAELLTGQLAGCGLHPLAPACAAFQPTEEDDAVRRRSPPPTTTARTRPE